MRGDHRAHAAVGYDDAAIEQIEKEVHGALLSAEGPEHATTGRGETSGNGV